MTSGTPPLRAWTAGAVKGRAPGAFVAITAPFSVPRHSTAGGRRRVAEGRELPAGVVGCLGRTRASPRSGGRFLAGGRRRTRRGRRRRRPSSRGGSRRCGCRGRSRRGRAGRAGGGRLLLGELD